MVTRSSSTVCEPASIALAAVEEMAQLQYWFTSATQQQTWGGDNFSYPCSKAMFLQQLNRPGTQSFSLTHTTDAVLLGFGQICDRFNCHHLARLVINPTYRGQGLAKVLIIKLIRQALAQQQRAISLYVHRHNIIALACYQSLGFSIQTPPEAENNRLYFMTLSKTDAAQLILQR